MPVLDWQECADLLELVSMLAEVFPAVMRDKRKEKMLLQCRLTLEKTRTAAGAGAGADDGWMLISKESDLTQVRSLAPSDWDLG